MTQPTSAGVAEVVAKFVSDQVHERWDVHVASPRSDAFDHVVAKLGARHHNWAARRQPTLYLLSEVVRIRQIIREVNPDIIHLHSAKAGLAGRLAVRGQIPTIFQPHGWSFFAGSRVTQLLAARWERYAVRFTTYFVAVSDDEVDAGNAAGVTGNFEIAPNGIDLDAFQVFDSRESKQTIGICPAAKTIVCVGRLCHQKGQDVLIEAHKHLLQIEPEAQLILVGDGPMRESLEAKADHRVVFAGHRSDVRPWLRAADVVVVSSRYEAGLSLATLEAMASGRSVVTTAVAGTALINSAAGAVVPVGDSRSLAAAIAARLSSKTLRDAEGARARHIVGSSFSQSHSNERIRFTYDRVLRPRVPPQ